MNPADLAKAAESTFAAVRSAKGDGIEVTSGGEDINREPACLFATEEAAMSSWLREFDWLRGQNDENGLVWFEKPIIEDYRITLEDGHGTYRIVSNRYVVRARVGFERVEVEPAEVVPKQRKVKSA